MCIIAFAKTRKVNKEEFRSCFNANSDGFGLAWRSKNKVLFKKGIMNLNEAWEFYDNKKIKGAHVLHFRIGTSGGKTKKLTHPFIISNDSPLTTSYSGDGKLLFHNGIISNWKDKFIMYMISSGIVPKGEISDTRVLAMITSMSGTKSIEEARDKFIVFSPTESLAWGRWEHETGVLFSNSGYSHTLVNRIGYWQNMRR